MRTVTCDTPKFVWAFSAISLFAEPRPERGQAYVLYFTKQSTKRKPDPGRPCGPARSVECRSDPATRGRGAGSQSNRDENYGADDETKGKQTMRLKSLTTIALALACLAAAGTAETKKDAQADTGPWPLVPEEQEILNFLRMNGGGEQGRDRRGHLTEVGVGVIQGARLLARS